MPYFYSGVRFLALVFFTNGWAYFSLAQTTTFNNAGADNLFANAANWSDGLPQSGETAIIPIGFTAVLNLSASIVSNYGLQVEGTLEVNPSTFEWTLQQALLVNGSFTNSSAVNLAAQSIFAGPIVNYGTLRNQDSLFVAANFTNAGMFQNMSGAKLGTAGYFLQIGTGAISNSGAWTNHSGGIIESYSGISNNSDFVNSGIVTSAGAWTNNGKMTNHNVFNNNNNLNNEGHIANFGTMASTLSLNNNDSLMNHGSLTLYGTTNNSRVLNNLGQLTTISGSLTNTNTGVVQNFDQFDHFGTLQNQGQLINKACATFKGQENSSLSNTITGVFNNLGIMYALAGSNINVSSQAGLMLTDPLASPAPSAVCVPTIQKTINFADVSINVSEADAGSSANYCGPLVLSLSQTTFSCSDRGNNTVTLTATDGLGNVSACFVQVQILDPIAPIINCPANINVVLNAPACGAIVDFNVTATDNCPFYTLLPLSSSLASGAFFPVGNSTVSYSVNDGFQSDTCSFQVSVTEQLTGAVLNCKTDLAVILNNNCEKLIAIADILNTPFGCADNYSISIAGNLNLDLLVGANIGVPLQGELKYGISGPSCTFDITVSDTIAPVLTCGTLSLSCAADIDALAQPIATDCAGTLNFSYVQTITALSNCEQSTVASLSRLYTVTDLSGNASTCVQNINLSNATALNISFPEPITIGCTQLAAIDQNGYPLPTVWPNPSLGAPGSPLVAGVPVVVGASASFCTLAADYEDSVLPGICEGAYVLNRQWTLSDACSGAQYTGSQQINIADNAAPTVVCPNLTTVSTTNNCTATVFLSVPSVQENCGGGLSYVATDDQGFVSNFKLVNAPVGTYTITWIATDACGNSASCSFITVVQDLVAPQITLGDTFTVSGNFINIDMLINSIADNCDPMPGILIKALDVLNGTAFQDTLFCPSNANSMFMVVQATDASGNISFDTVMVLFFTNALPISLTCPADATINTNQLELLNSLEIYGQPTLLNPAGSAVGTIINATLPNYNDCQGGSVLRIFSVQDVTNDTTVFCIQKIFVLPATDWSVTFPADTVANACTPISITSIPILSGDAEHVIFSYTDQSSPNICPVVLRKWTVIDTCAYQSGLATNTDSGIELGNLSFADNGDGYFSYSQSIAISDTEAPFIQSNCATNLTFLIDTCSANIDISILVADNCATSLMTTLDIESQSFSVTQPVTNAGISTFNLLLPLGQFVTQFTVTDLCGNQNTCNGSITVVDTSGLCAIGNEIAGLIQQPNQQPIANLALTLRNLNQNLLAESITSATGWYAFTQLPPAENYILEVQWPQKRLAGLDIQDLDITQAVTPWQLIAADVNADQQLNVADGLALRNLLLGKTESSSWMLLPAQTPFANPQQPWSSNYPENQICSAGPNQNFVAFRSGDINLDAFAVEKTLLATQILLETPTTWTPKNIYQLPVYGDLQTLSALQFALSWSAQAATFVTIVPGAISDIDLAHTFTPNNKQLHVVWQGAPIYSTEPLFYLVFEAENETPNWSFNADALAPKILAEQELYQANLLAQVAVNPTDVQQPIVFPNPTAAGLSIAVALPQASRIEIQVMDGLGRKILQRVFDAEKGKSELKLESAALPSGQFYVRISHAGGTWMVPAQKI